MVILKDFHIVAKERVQYDPFLALKLRDFQILTQHTLNQHKTSTAVAFKKSDIVLHLSAHVLTHDVIHMDLFQNLLKNYFGGILYSFR